MAVKYCLLGSVLPEDAILLLTRVTDIVKNYVTRHDNGEWTFFQSLSLSLSLSSTLTAAHTHTGSLSLSLFISL